MSALVVAACWSMVVGEVARRTLGTVSVASDERAAATWTRSIGRWCRTRRVLRWAGALGPEDDVTIGRLAIGTAVSAVVAPPVGLGAAVVGTAAVIGRARRRAAPVQASPLELADVLDLMLVAIAAGHGILSAIDTLSSRADPPFDEAARRANQLLAAGAPLADAVATLFGPGGDPGRRVAGAIDDAVRDGTSISATLLRASDEIATIGRRAAETRARRLPVQMLFPLVSCVLPAFVLLTVVPLLAGSIGALPL